MVSSNATFWPIIAHAALVFFLYWLLSHRRVSAVKSGTVRAEQFRKNLKEPEDSLLVHNNLRNQFELPVMFYAVSLALYASTADNWGTVALGWVFVLSRYLHTYVHLTSNRLRYRRPLFIIGFTALVAMWGWLVIWVTVN